jgi:hypothetical protein
MPRGNRSTVQTSKLYTGHDKDAKGKRRGDELGESGSAIFGSGCARLSRILNLETAAN